MSDLLLSLILGLIQGLTEFLPISSSAHLILPEKIFATQDLGLSFDIAVHAGTLMAVIYFFKSDLLRMSKAVLFNDIELRQHKILALQLIVATLPIIFIGLYVNDIIDQRPFEIAHIAIANLIFAALLLFAFLYSKPNIKIYQLTFYGALVIGVIQSFALIPGASRSGMAITAALFLGLNLKDSSKFAFMLGIPTILGAIVFLILEIIRADIKYDLLILGVGFFTSAIFAFFSISIFLKFVEKIGMIPFVIYRFILGIVLLLISIS